MARKKKESKLFYLEYSEGDGEIPIPEMTLRSVDVDKENILEAIEGVESQWEINKESLERWDKDLNRAESGRPWVPVLERQLEVLMEEGIVKEKELVEVGLIDE